MSVLVHELMDTSISTLTCIYKSLSHELNGLVEFVESGMVRHAWYS